MSEMVQTDLEVIDNVHMTWNMWPRTKVERPTSARSQSLPQSPRSAPTRTSRLSITPHSTVRPVSPSLTPSLVSTTLICIFLFCFQRNPFPHHYSTISETNVPAELDPRYTTIEYSLPALPDPSLLAHQSLVFNDSGEVD
ncbi:hypothetical protein U1Q18_002405 [Sarracenia purpurea var. burkii]